MTSDNVLHQATAEANAEIKAFNPEEIAGATLPKNLKDLDGQALKIIAAKITKGPDYNQATLIVIPDGETKPIEVSSYSQYVLTAVEAMIKHNALPCRLKPIKSGRALYFAQA